MSYPTTTAAPRATSLASGGLLRRAWAANWPLTLVGLAMIPILLAALLGLALDPRVITGQPAWLKPAKFAISIAIYSFTFIWMLGFVQGARPRRLASIAASGTALAAAVETVIIVGQVVRGVGSHFNVATPFDTALFSTMGAFIVMLWAMGLLLAGLLLFQRLPEAGFAWGLRLGLLVSMVGAGLGFLMTTPTAAQREAWANGAPVTLAGAHAVGIADGGPGLPIVGWSTTGGDIRVAHFIGLHAMQVLPYLGWLATRRRWRLGAGQRVALVIAAGAGHLGLVLITAWQALRAQPLLAPDALTLLALGGLAAALLVATATILLSGRRRAA